MRAEQLERRLSRNLANVYVVYGDESLQREECLDAIRNAARIAGFTQRIVLHAETNTDWSKLADHMGAFSLFAERRLIDLRVPSGSPGKEGALMLTRYATAPPPDTILVLSCHRLDRRSTTTQWFKALEGAGDVVEVHPIRAADLTRWIVARCTTRGIAIERDAAELIAQRSEGNLLACAQEIDKLRLLIDGHRVTTNDVVRTVSDNARFKAFDLVDPVLEGDARRVIRILRTLSEEGVEPIQILGTLMWTIRGLCTIATGLEGGARLEEVLQGSNGAWRRRRQTIKCALSRMPRRDWVRMLDTAEGVDRILKGAPTRSGAIIPWSHTDGWDALERLALTACKVKLPPSAPYH